MVFIEGKKAALGRGEGVVGHVMFVWWGSRVSIFRGVLVVRAMKPARNRTSMLR
jgi:hypothetical protein